MTRLPGAPLEDHFTTCPNIEAFAVKLGHVYKNLQQPHFPAIGSLYLTDELPDHVHHIPCPEYPGFTVGPIVDSHFFYENRRVLPSNRGPFPSEHEWVLSQLDFQCIALENPPIHEQDGEDDEDGEDAEERSEQLKACRRLRAPAEAIFPASEPLAAAIISPHDVAARNLLVDPETGELTGWVDWESVRIVPAWFAAREVEAFQGPEMYNTYEEMRRQIEEAEVYWEETNVPEENRIESRKNVLTMRLRERFRDGAGATMDMEEKEVEKVVFMEMFDHLDLDAARVLEWCQGWEEAHATEDMEGVEQDRISETDGVEGSSDLEKVEAVSPPSPSQAQGRDPEKGEEESPPSPSQAQGGDPKKVEELSPLSPPQILDMNQAKEGLASLSQAGIRRISRKSFWKKSFWKKSFWQKCFCCFGRSGSRFRYRRRGA